MESSLVNMDDSLSSSVPRSSFVGGSGFLPLLRAARSLLILLPRVTLEGEPSDGRLGDENDRLVIALPETKNAHYVNLLSCIMCSTHFAVHNTIKFIAVMSNSTGS